MIKFIRYPIINVLILIIPSLFQSGCEKEILPEVNQRPTVIIEGPDLISTGTGNVTFRWWGEDIDGEIEKYRYKLLTSKELESLWSQWNAYTEKTYTNLVNGGYIFLVQAMDNDGDTSDVGIKSFVIKIDVPPPSSLYVDNFDNCTLGYNLLGGLSGTWNKYPNNTTQGIKDFPDNTVKYGEGCSLRLEYDVDSPNPALNGYFFILNRDTLKGQDLTPYDTLVFFAKGDEEKGFTSKFKVELKRPEYTGEAVCTTAKGLNRLWQQIELPFNSFRPYGSYQRISDWSKVTKLLITFEYNNVDEDNKSGTIYLDDVYFH